MRKRAHNFIDLTGKKFNRLLAVRVVEIKNRIKWECICDCGNKTVVSPAKLKSGHTKSCGCLQSEKTAKLSYKHGFSKTRLPNVRNTMVQRCSNKNTIMYHRYGGRGIKVCDDWVNNPKSFYEWATKHGYREGLTIDRINNDGNYEPSNCQWITLKENISKNAKLSRSDISDICKLYQASKITQKKIAEIYKVDKSRIGQILKEYNITITYRGGIKKKFNKNEIQEIKNDNRTAKEIAAAYKASRSTIYKIRRGKYEK